MAHKGISLIIQIILMPCFVAACIPQEVINDVTINQEIELETGEVITVEVEVEMEDEQTVIFALYQEPQILNPFIAA